MTDKVDRATRSRMMAGIRSKNTRPEVQVRSGLHRAGFRYRLHQKNLPGRPDIVLAQHGAIVEVHGCFWHGHDCSLYRLPGNNREFWKQKIRRNRLRDRKNRNACLALGWRVAVVWECSLKGPGRIGAGEVSKRLLRWLGARTKLREIRGRRIRKGRRGRNSPRALNGVRKGRS